MLILLQTLICLIVVLFTGFLLIDGWLSKGVWVKGSNKGPLASVTEMESWATKKYREPEPDTYWFFMGFYAIAFLFFLLLIIL